MNLIVQENGSKGHYFPVFAILPMIRGSKGYPEPEKGSNRVDGFLALQGPLDKSDSDDRISATTSTPCLKNTIVVIDANNNEATGEFMPVQKTGRPWENIFYDTISDIISSVEQVTDPATNSEAKKAKRKKRKDKEEILVEPIITPKNILSSLRHVSF